MSAKIDLHNGVTLWPNRSMTPQGKKLFYGGLLAGGTLATCFSVAAGLWPIAVFVNVAFAGAAAGVFASDITGHQYEQIRVAGSKIEVHRYKPGAKTPIIESLPLFMLKVEAKCDYDGNCENVLLRSGSRPPLRVGAFLSPDEKKSLAIDLSNAIKDITMPHHLRP